MSNHPDIDVLIAAAARNNAQWCDAVCRSHGLATRLTIDAWYCDDEPPPFYGRLVSLTRDADVLERLISGHRRAGAGEWGVKDSFGVLDDGPDRRRLFTAVWYARHADAPTPADTHSCTVTTVDELESWIAAWGETPPDRAVFVPALLAERGVSFVHDGSYQAGLVAYADGAQGVIGVTNFFGDAAMRNVCVADVAARHPGTTLVGYGSPEEATSLAAVGFDTLSPLTIWLQRDVTAA